MKHKNAKRILSVLATVLIHLPLYAQDTIVEPDTMQQTISSLYADLQQMKKLSFSGYMQPQFQVSDSAGAASVAGGNFASGVDKRFMLRRARMKFTYKNNLSQYVFQFDVSEKGLTIKDLYARFTEPHLQLFSLTAGMMNRPFGFEIGYSSSNRESPERGRMSQTIFPNERDLGAMLTIQAPKISKWSFLKLESGFYNGTGGPSAGKDASDFDLMKDFISHLSFAKTSASEKVNVSGGLSFYRGGIRQSNKYLYDGIHALTNGNQGFLVDSSTLNKGRFATRQYMGGDLQLTFDWAPGITILRGEYISGQQPGTSATSSSPSADPAADTYIRQFNGAYFYFIQNIGQSKHQLVAKYDWYDPNTEIQGDAVAKTGTGTGKTDLKYTTLGLGWNYKWDENVKFLVYYDMVTNETSANLAGYTKDLKDNVLTLRMQYKF